MGSNILKDIVSKISPKIEKLKLFINDETLNEENFNLTIFDLVNPKNYLNLNYKIIVIQNLLIQVFFRKSS